MSTTYLRPIYTLIEGWLWKAIVSALTGLFAHDVQLVVLVAFLVTLDLVTGIWKSLQNGDFCARGMRKTGVKVIEYVILLSVIGALSNAFDVLTWAVQTAYLYVAVTEVSSIVENISDGKEENGVISKAWAAIKARINKRLEQPE